MNIDVAIIKEGWYGDTSRMYFVGEPSVRAKRLVDITYQSMVAGIKAVRLVRRSATSVQAFNSWLRAQDFL